MIRRMWLASLLLALLLGIVGAPPARSAPADRGGAPHHPDLLLVAFDPGAPAAQRAAAHAQQGARVENTMEWLHLDVVRLRDGDAPTDAAARYERNPVVAYAHPNWEMSAVRTPNDPLFRDEWGLHNTGQIVTGSLVKGAADADIDAPEGWDVAYGTAPIPSGGGTRVGILDSGIDQAHVDLLGKTKACAMALTGRGIVTEGSCVDDNSHGTHVAGTVAAIADNSVGVAGVAPDAELAVFKALNSAGSGFYADVVAGIHWLGSSTGGAAPIISMSIGGPEDGALNKQLTQSWDAGVLLIAAAGNDGDSTKSWPAYHEDVMSVSAIDAAGDPAWFTTCNSDVEIAAPGEDVWSTLPGNTYGPLSGTSMATPHVSGAASVVWSQNTGWSNSQVRTQLTSQTEGNGGCNGVGVLNLAVALGAAAPQPEPEPTDPGGITGKVSDQRSKAVIQGAIVDCGAAGSATTDVDGTYSITDVTPSTYECTASATGYRSKSASVTVSSGAVTTANFALRATR